MASFEVAHVHEQGIDLIIVPRDSSFGYKSNIEQGEVIAALQRYSASAGLAGTVVPVWPSGDTYCFIAHPNWHAFFRSLCWNDIVASINKEVTIS